MKKIYCPYCNLRLFDTTNDNKGRIEIKCRRCHKIVKIDLNDFDIFGIDKELENFVLQISKVAV